MYQADTRKGTHIRRKAISMPTALVFKVNANPSTDSKGSSRKGDLSRSAASLTSLRDCWSSFRASPSLLLSEIGCPDGQSGEDANARRVRVETEAHTGIKNQATIHLVGQCAKSKQALWLNIIFGLT